jgi:hypothetical protein
MSQSTVTYHCRACGAESTGASLVAGAWGDRCCPYCGSPDLERRRSRWEAVYATFFLYKVY